MPFAFFCIPFQPKSFELLVKAGVLLGGRCSNKLFNCLFKLPLRFHPCANYYASFLCISVVPVAKQQPTKICFIATYFHSPVFFVAG
jgi:hypothetical protein